MAYLQKIQEKIEEIANREHISCEIWEESKNIIAVSISWGDWKHDHARLKHYITQELEPTGYTTEVTEEDGSDCYSAIHRFVF